MFSSRIHWSLESNRLNRLLESKRAAGTGILDLTESNPTVAGFQYARVELPNSPVYEPSAKGLASARAAVSEYYDGAVPPDRILLTASTSEAYAYLFKLLANPGDEVLVPRPSYPLFEFLGALESVRIVQYPLYYQGGWTLDARSIEHAVTDRTRAIVLVNPNNPTGSYLKTHEYGELIRICAAHGLAILSDEVFNDYAFAPDTSRVATLTSTNEVLTFAMSGLSKVCGLPQMKLGWIAVNGPEPARREALDRLELIADTFLSVGTPVQQALPVLLPTRTAIQEQIAARTRGNLQRLRERIGRHSPLELLAVEGGWYATLKVPRIHGEEDWVLELLDRYNVLVQPGYFYDFESEAYLVLSLLTPEDVFRRGIEAVLEFTTWQSGSVQSQ